MSVGKYHVHVLVELVDNDISRLCKLAKGRSTTALRKSGFKEMKWVRGYHTRFIESYEEAKAAWRYVSRHKRQGSLTRTITPIQS
jgi:REP element-mobilizing transposase RayT